MEAANGFANRFLYVGCRRARVLPFGGNDRDHHAIKELSRKMRAAIRVAQSIGEVTFDPSARPLWERVYGQLGQAPRGIVGHLVSRAEPHALRIAMIYAVLDGSSTIRREHLLAALAIWTYSRATTVHVFGGRAGHELSDSILDELQHSPDGLVRSSIYRLASGHPLKTDIDTALGALTERGLVRIERQRTSGRPREVWFATGRPVWPEGPDYVEIALGAVAMSTSRPSDSDTAAPHASRDGEVTRCSRVPPLPNGDPNTTIAPANGSPARTVVGGET